MRLFPGVLACIGVSAFSIALADPASDATAAPATSSPAAASAPATPAAPAAVSAATLTPAPAASSSDEQLEKHFLSEGYKVQMRGGQKQYCRREASLGTRLGGEVACSTLQQLKNNEDQMQSALQHQQHSYTKPTG